MTKKDIQRNENKAVEEMLKSTIGTTAEDGWYEHLNKQMDYLWHTFGERLYNCNAKTYWKDGRVFLKSYQTVIGCIDTDGTCYDWLRLVYGYTATSAKQMSKFAKKFNANKVFCWKEV